MSTMAMISEKTTLIDELVEEITIDIPSTTSLNTPTKTRSHLDQLYTLYLFIRSDFKTVIIPQSIFAICAATTCIPASSTSNSTTPSSFSTTTTTFTPLRITCMLLWLILHLLVENISNQRLPSSVLEDAANKPWRPIPAGRITPAESQAILRAAVPSCLLLSAVMGNILPSGMLLCCVWLYNDLNGSGAGPVMRNAINAAGLACFGWGALLALVPEAMSGHGKLVASPVGGVELGVLQVWIGIIAMIVFTTVHAADFPDVEGDEERGRRTMPLVYGESLSRWVLAVAVLGWTVACLVFWGVELGIFWVAPLAVGGTMAVMSVSRKGHKSDEMVWKLWCLWAIMLFTLPAVGAV